MLDAKFVRENLEAVAIALQNRGSDVSLDEYIHNYDSLKKTTTSLDNLRCEKKALSKGGRPTEQEIERAKVLSLDIKKLETEQREFRDWIESFLLNLPNIPHSSVPVGKSDKDNVVVKTWGRKPIWTPEGQLMYNGAGKPIPSRLRMLVMRVQTFLGI